LARSGKDGKKFEKKLSELEEIVAKLESGETPLEESLVLFEKGTSILKELTGILEEAERKVEVLTRDMAGALVSEPFEGEEEPDA
jgi:exodeoxyribonuclease VII small subunit